MSGKEHVNILLFNKWVTDKIQIKDLGLQKVISLKPAVIPSTSGRHVRQRFKKADVNIVERLANKMMHFGKKICKKYRQDGWQKQRC